MYVYLKMLFKKLYLTLFYVEVLGLTTSVAQWNFSKQILIWVTWVVPRSAFRCSQYMEFSRLKPDSWCHCIAFIIILFLLKQDTRQFIPQKHSNGTNLTLRLRTPRSCKTKAMFSKNLPARGTYCFQVKKRENSIKQLYLLLFKALSRLCTDSYYRARYLSKWSIELFLATYRIL